MNLEGSRILITGGTGQIASHVIDQLIAERPKEIIAFDKNLSSFEENRSPELDYKSVTLLKGDITHVDEVREALNGVDFVVHTASLLTRETLVNLRGALEVNICGTFNLLEGCVASRVKKLIYSSSVSVYGEPVINPMTEEHPFNTNTMYGAGKVSSELFLRIFKKTMGLEYIALRYAVVYGSRQHSRGNRTLFIPESFSRIEQGLPPMIHEDNSQSYDYVYVEDVARANVLALKSPITGKSFNIGTGVATTVRDIVRMIIDISGTSLEPVYAPQMARPGLESFTVDVTTAENVLGFRSEIPVREGLKRYYDWRKKMRL